MTRMGRAGLGFGAGIVLAVSLFARVVPAAHAWPTEVTLLVAMQAGADTSALSVERDLPPQRKSKPRLRPLHDGVYALKTIVSDTWFVITSPTRMDRQDALVTLGVAAVGGVLYAYDSEIEDAFLRSQGQTVYELMVKPGRAIEPVGNMGNTLVYYVSGMAIGYAFRIDPLRELTSTFIESHFVSGGARNLAEITIGRTRPFEKRGARYFAWQGGTSFPSGHASVAMELATILSHHGHSKPFSALCYAAATSLCLERLDSEGHWASDVWFGAVTGHVIARTILTRREKRRLSREQAMGWRESILPLATERDGVPTFGIRASF
jgi:hypothetical protein